jgi:hypothetical protein
MIRPTTRSLLVIMGGLFALACTDASKSPQVERLQRDFDKMDQDAKNIADELKNENDVGKKHELSNEEALLHSRMERVRLRLELEKKK